MSPIFIAIISGIVASGALWVDHTLIRKKTEELSKSDLIKGFLLGFGVGYIAANLVGMEMDTGVDKLSVGGIDDISDSLKIGMPKF
jgi:hypothetical protein